MRTLHPGALATVVALLSAWLGAALLFAARVAPSAFAVLPARALAGALVGRVLPVLFLSGIVVGVVALWLTRRAADAPWPTQRLLGAALLVVGCAVAQFVIGPQIDAARAAIGPSVEALATGDPRRIAFGRLHGISVMFLGIGMLGGAGTMLLSLLALRR